MKILGKTAIVTGGGSGLGAATARMLAASGANVCVADRNAEAADTVAVEIRGLAAAADTTDPIQMEAAVKATVERFGAVHILVCCAGIIEPARVLGKEGPMPLEKFRRTIHVNVLGSFNAIRLAAAAMDRNEPDEEGERGVVITTASVAAFDGQIGQAAYSASKGAVAAMTLPLARDLARHGIRVMTIAPGTFETPMMAGLSAELRASLAAQVPFPSRLGRPSEYAQLAKAIIENPMLNGEVIRLDGALRMGPK